MESMSLILEADLFVPNSGMALPSSGRVGTPRRQYVRVFVFDCIRCFDVRKYARAKVVDSDRQASSFAETSYGALRQDCVAMRLEEASPPPDRKRVVAGKSGGAGER